MRIALTIILIIGSALSGLTLAESVTHEIILIGGVKSEGSGRHDYPNGIRLLKAYLESSPDVRAIEGLVVNAYPDGWPADPDALNGASTIVWYFDGLEQHPLLDATQRAHFESLMQQGVGLIALHQASTIPEDDMIIQLERSLGAARYGMFDRTTEMVEFTPNGDHPIHRGVKTFTYRDEFYPTFRRNPAGRDITPILTGDLHVQFRDGEYLIIDQPTPTTVAWTFERDNGGRSFGFSGAHYFATLQQPEVRKMLLNAIFWTAGLDVPGEGVRLDHSGSPDMLTFHFDSQRTGWRSTETVLVPTSVTDSSFGMIWESPQFDGSDDMPARLYASPLYVDQLQLSDGEYEGRTFAVVIAATSNGYVYAVNAIQAGDLPPGRILWRAQLGTPCRLEPVPLDGVATGVLSTPVIDITQQRLYVTSCDQQERWQAHALDISSGKTLPGWPVKLDDATFNAPGINKNAGSGATGPARRFDYRVQRGALNLSPDGTLLYVTFGESPTGWLVAVDTSKAAVTTAFASVAEPHRGGGGIWGAGGPAVDVQGNVYVVTGTNFSGYVDQSHDWVQSVLKLSLNVDGFALRGTYTPFNYCETAKMDIDLGSGGVVLIPGFEADVTSTPHLLVVGGKQGNVYLLNRADMPGRLDGRQSCSNDSAGDLSLLSPDDQPQFGQRGPINIFGPYSEVDGAMNMGRSRSVPAYIRNSDGASFVFVTGNAKNELSSPHSIPPSLARLEIVTAPGQAAYLRVDQLEQSLVFGNPGSPIITSDGEKDAIVWVLDMNAERTALLVGDNAPQPVLYALDALTLKVLWNSNPGELHPSGKYNEPAFGRGAVFVGTDRIQAFGLRPMVKSALQETDGQVIYESRCAACHDHPEGRIPPRELISLRSQSYIADALMNGSMRPLTAGMSTLEIEAVAAYLARPEAPQ